jgi:hypothetical protein
VLCAALFTACSNVTQVPAKAPPPIDPETRVVPQKEEERPRLIAPPPAYGNRVVLATAKRRHGAF